MFNQETITAISTPGGIGAIGIIRISGNKAHEIANKIYKGKTDFNSIKAGTISYGRLYNYNLDLELDEIMISKFTSPKSFTKEDMVEINTHGGIIVQKNVLELIINSGARLAEPGEFTKRAFLNGRIDLSQAEGVIDIINAKTDLGTKAALMQLEGSIKKKVNILREGIVEAIAKLEVLIDYPEYEVEEDVDKILDNLIPIKEKLVKDIKDFEKGRIIREGINVVIIGKPNVGKSSLLNILSGNERAIVTEIPGTTRDTIIEQINLKGILLNVIDTAGIRDTDDIVEKIGVKKAREEIEKADLIIAILDGSNSDFIEEEEILKQIKNRKSILIINKIDISNIEKIKIIEEHLKNKKYYKVSILKEEGIENIQDGIYNMFMDGDLENSSAELVTNIRHKMLMEKARDSLYDAYKAYNEKHTVDILTIDLRNAAEALGEITGENVNEEVLKTIFERFCLGK